MAPSPTSQSMMSLLHYLVLVALFLVLAVEVTSLQRNLTGLGQDGNGNMVMEEEELVGLFEVMADLLDDPDQDWAQLHPLPCTDTPWPGLQCEIGDEMENGGLPLFHVTRIHIGPDVTSSPPCKPLATFPRSTSFLKLPYLRSLSIFNCFLTSPVVLSPLLFVGGFSSLEHLSLNSNPSLIGEVPSSLELASKLRVLSLSQNGLHGSIPDVLGGLVSLEQLDLSYNNLSGEIPEGIGGLKSLTILDLSSNGLQGGIPSSLGQLQLLQKIDLGSNKISGRVPPELGRLNRLVLLDLSHNLITGPIPPSFSGLVQLQYLTLDHNPLNSGLPLFFFNLGRLTSVSFSGCGLVGTIPNNFFPLANLTAISLDDNSLTGSIPPSLGSLPNLDQLNVSHNQLSGELLLPEEFISRLGKRLDVRGNRGLCTSNKTFNYKYHLEHNISEYLGATPVCLATIASNNKTCPQEKLVCPHETSKGKEPYAWDQGRAGTSSCCCLCLKLELLIFCVLLCYFFMSWIS